jgi:uncharacterized protein (TIGR02598 family)
VRGFTLAEVIVAAGLVAMSALMIVTLLPSGVLSLKKAENLQAATAYALEVIEAHRAHSTVAPDFKVTLNDTQFRVQSTTRAVPHPSGRLQDVLVTVTWNRQPQPVSLATRLYDRTRP